MDLDITGICSPHLHDEDPASVDVVLVGWGDATKHRQVLTTEGGRTLRLKLPRGSYLSDGCVLWHDDTVTVVVRRPAEDAIVVPFEPCSEHDDPGVVARWIRLGYVLGNAHAPVEYADGALQTPLFTSPAGAQHLLADLGVNGSVQRVPLARHGWSGTSADHAEHHHHD